MTRAGPTSGAVKKVGGELRQLMRAEIASQTGSRYRLPGLARAGDGTNLAAVIDKRSLRALGQRHNVHEDIEEEEADEVVAPLRTFLQGPFGCAAGVALLVAAAFGLGVAVGGRRRAVIP